MHDRGCVVVTGSSGFVGSHIVAKLTEAGYEVVGLDRDSPVAGAGPSEYVACDVTDRERFAWLIASIAPVALIHAAAITPGDTEQEQAHRIVEVNQISTLTALIAAARAGCKRFVYLSSAGVYADPTPSQILSETSPVADGGGLYAQTKLAGERLCIWASRELALATTALRIGPVYGEFERPTGSRSQMSPVYRAIEIAATGGKIRCNARDTIYNWIHGSDVGSAIAAVLSSAPSQPVYNLAGPPVTIASTLKTLCNLVSEVECVWTTTAEDANLVVSEVSRPISSSLIESELAFQPAVNLHAGLARLFAARRDGEG